MISRECCSPAVRATTAVRASFKLLRGRHEGAGKCHMTQQRGRKGAGKLKMTIERGRKPASSASTSKRLLAEGVMSLKEAYKKNNIDVSYWTMLRHATHGVRSIDGRTVKLESLKVGGKRLTSIEAVARFVERQNTPPANGQDEVAALEDAKQDDDYLKKHGLGRDDD